VKMCSSSGLSCMLPEREAVMLNDGVDAVLP
jgi:hypothetical protein